VPTTPPPPTDHHADAAQAALLRGDSAAARAHCRAGLEEAARDGAPPSVVGALMRLDARVHLLEGDDAAALEVLQAALTMAEDAGDVAGAAHALNARAIVHFRHGAFDDAAPIFEAARARARDVGDRALLAATSMNLGNLATIHGDLRRAVSYHRRAVADLRTLDRARDLAGALSNLGLAYAGLQRHADAEAAYREAITACERAGDADSEARVRSNLAELLVARGDLAAANDECARARTLVAQLADAPTCGEVHRISGVVARESGALATADAHFAEAERVARERHDQLLLAETAREQADLYRRQSRNRDTLQALNRSHRLFEEMRARRFLADVGRRMQRLEGDFVAVARRWGESIEAKDRYTQGHCQRVADLACLVAERAGPAEGFDAQAMFWFRIGALLHDVGKLGIPAEVLNKPGKLTDAEFALMRSHTTEGVRMLAEVEFPWDVRPIVESHHERWDGRGYPHGLAGDAIPLTARILCVADVYDALTSVRSYKRALSHDEAMDLLRRDVGSAFDPRVFAWFEAVAPAWGAQAGQAPAVDASARDAQAEREALGLDGLTGLPRRGAFFDECARVLSARADDGRPTSLLIVRLVNLAALAAERGRGAADAALSAVADALSRNTRGGDFVGRYADDEFVVVLPDVPLGEALAVAARLTEASTAARACVPGVRPVTPRVAVGAAAAPPVGATPSLLLAAADGALARVLDAEAQHAAAPARRAA
jgi:diguanylate cyclase (GGDEF)-like protein/putative nucleotidyltransferase with HDIG domain